MYKKLLLKIFTIYSLASISINSSADVAGDLGGFFNSLGYDGNITSGTAYQGQAAGYYSGGNAFLRNNVKNLQVIYLDAPDYKMGCGGIDLFMGGFSFVNTEAITKFFQSVMSNAAGYAFNLALETVVPEIAHGMQYIQKIAQDINDNNFNSCEMAENLIGGLWPKTEAGQRHICKDVASNRANVFKDWAEARQGCRDAEKRPSAMNAANQDEKSKKKLIGDKNLIWDALWKNKFLSEATEIKERVIAEFFMSLSGTIVYKSGDKVIIYNSLAKDSKLLNALLKGGEATIYRCDEPEKCLNPTKGAMTINEENGLYVKTQKAINRIVEALQQDSGPLPEDLKDFLDTVKFPVLAFIKAHLMANNNVAMALSITNYSESIAKVLLMQYMHEALQTVENGLAGTDYDPEIHKRLTDQIHQALIYVEGIKTQSHNDIQELATFIESSKRTEKEVTSKVVGQLKNKLGVKS